jgi:DNA polymerase-3 subunit alpha
LPIDNTSELKMPDCEEWINLERLKKEREVVGIYISAHPLDDYLKEINNFTSTGLSSLSDLNRIVNKDFYVGGIINEVEHLVSKTGNGFGVFSFEDFNDQYKFRIFGEDYLKYKHLIEENKILRLRIAVKEGWVNRETGRVGDPRIQFLNMELLDGIIDSSSKKITFKIDSSNFNENELKKLKNIFTRKNMRVKKLFLNFMIWASLIEEQIKQAGCFIKEEDHSESDLAQYQRSTIIAYCETEKCYPLLLDYYKKKYAENTITSLSVFQ